MLICLCSVSSGQFYLLCWCHATQRSRPSSPRWTTTAIPSPRTLTSPRALSRRAIFQVGTRRAHGRGATGPTAPSRPPRPSLHAALAPDSEPHPCWERTRGLGSLLANDAFLGRRSSGVTLPPGLLRAVICFGSRNSDAVSLSPPLRPGPEYRQHPRRSGGCRGVGAPRARQRAESRPVSQPAERLQPGWGLRPSLRFCSAGRNGLHCHRAQMFLEAPH